MLYNDTEPRRWARKRFIALGQLSTARMHLLQTLQVDIWRAEEVRKIAELVKEIHDLYTIQEKRNKYAKRYDV